MSRRKAPTQDLELFIGVRHPESEPDEGATAWRDREKKQPILPEVDADGHQITFGMSRFPRGQDGKLVSVVSVHAQRGMDPGAVANILRKLAKHIDRHGHKMLNLPYDPGVTGTISPGGDLVMDESLSIYDDDGNLTDPQPE